MYKITDLTDYNYLNGISYGQQFINLKKLKIKKRYFDLAEYDYDDLDE